LQLVQSNPSQELGNFLDFIYGSEKGYAYAPIKDPVTEDWAINWYEWPVERDNMIAHFRTNSPEVEVYFSPALYREPTRPDKGNVLGSSVIWTEFDGLVPESMGEIPDPSVRVQSSGKDRQHVYWKLDSFLDDYKILEQVNRAICYALHADGTAWDCTQVLRPINSLNHKRRDAPMPVILLSKNANVYNVEAFGRIPIPPVVVGDINTDDLPDAINVISKYAWRESDFKFFRSMVQHPGRSVAMMRLGYICCELKMQDQEAYAILLNADERWGKYKKRLDRKARLTEIINRARIKHPFTESVEESIIYNNEEFLSIDIQIEWIIPGILQRAGHVLLTGPPGIGKTQLSLGFSIHMALGKDFLGWKLGKPQRILFVSMEMGHADLKYFVEQMEADLSSEERELLRDNLHFVPLGFGIRLDSESGQNKVNDLIKRCKPQGIIFDSLGLSTEEELSDDVAARKMSNYTAKLREDNDLFVWFIHHNRKAQAANKKPNKLSDVFGSMYYTAAATTVIGLWPLGPRLEEIEITGLKVRLSKPFPTFVVARTVPLGFERSLHSYTGLQKQSELPPAPKEDIDENPSDPRFE
jgi:KaiC/GvpD/RAD55 family RecA-like ATPase